jgi:hypothetical protein
MLLRACRYYWRAIAATVILVVAGSMAISIMVTRPSFKVAYTGDELKCPSMLSAPNGGDYDMYWYGQEATRLTNEQLDLYVKKSGLGSYTDDALGRVYQRVDMNLALICSDLKASQQGRLVATLGVGTFLLAFLAVPYGSVRRGRRES